MQRQHRLAVRQLLLLPVKYLTSIWPLAQIAIRIPASRQEVPWHLHTERDT